METLESLYNKKQYELILNLTSNNDEPKKLMYRINAFLALNQIENAIECFDLNIEKMYDTYSLYTVTTYFNLLLQQENYQKAAKMISLFKDFKYISQEIEEIIQDYYVQITTPQKHKKIYDVDTIIELINKSNSELEKIDLLHKLKNMNITDYINDIISILNKDGSDFYKTFVLLLLINNKIDVDLTYSNSRGIYKLNPSKMIPPFTDHFYSLIRHFIEKISNNPTMNNTSYDLLDQFILSIYPENIEKFISQPSFAAIIFLSIAHKYMSQDFDLSILDEYELSLEKFEEYKKIVTEILTSGFQDLKN